MRVPNPGGSGVGGNGQRCGLCAQRGCVLETTHAVTSDRVKDQHRTFLATCVGQPKLSPLHLSPPGLGVHPESLGALGCCRKASRSDWANASRTAPATP